MASIEVILSSQNVVSDPCLSRHDSINSFEIQQDRSKAEERDFSPVATSIEKNQFDFRLSTRVVLPWKLEQAPISEFSTNQKKSFGTMPTSNMSGSKQGSKSRLKPSIFLQQGKKKQESFQGVPLKACQSKKDFTIENPVHLIKKRRTERPLQPALAHIPESDGNTQPAESPEQTHQEVSPIIKERPVNIMTSGIRFNSKGTMRVSDHMGANILSSPDKFYLLMYARSKSCLELFKSRLFSGLSCGLKIYATLTKKRPEYNSLNCVCFLELYRGTNRLVTYPWCTSNIYKIASLVYEEDEVDQFFPLEYLMEQEDMKEFAFMWNYFTEKEVAHLMRDYLREADPVTNYFAKFRRSRDQSKLVSCLYRHLRKLDHQRKSALATRVNSPTSSPHHSLKKVAFDPSLGPDPDSLKHLAGVDPQPALAWASSGSRAEVCSKNAVSLIFEDLMPTENLVFLASGYSHWVKGFFKMIWSPHVPKPSDEKFKKLMQRIKLHLEESHDQPSKSVSQIAVNTGVLQYIGERLAGCSLEEIEKLGSAKPVPHWLSRFVASGDFDMLLVELKAAVKHAISASMGRFNQSHQELRIRLSRLEASPSQALSQSEREKDLNEAKRRASLNRFVTSSGLVRQQRAKRIGAQNQLPFVLPRAPEEGMSDIGENLSASQETPSSDEDSFFYGDQPDLSDVCDRINRRVRCILDHQMVTLKKHLNSKLSQKEQECLDYLLQEDNIFLLEQLLKMDHQPDEKCVNMAEVEAHIRPFLAAKVQEQEDLITVDKEESDFERSRAFIMADLKVYFDQNHLQFTDYDALIKQAVDADENVLGIYECFSIKYTYESRNKVRHETLESLDLLAKVLNGKQKGREIRKRLVSEQLKVGINSSGLKKSDIGDTVHPDSCPAKQRESWPNTFNKALEKSRAQKILAEISASIGQVVTDIFEKVVCVYPGVEPTRRVFQSRSAAVVRVGE